MKHLVFGHDEEMAAWAEAAYPECAPLCRPLTAIGIAEGTDICGVAVYHNYRQYDIEITFVTATQKWATPGTVRALLRYPFIQLGVKRMTGITKKSNKNARTLMSKLGFVLEGVHPFAAGGSTACTYGLYEKTAKERWLRNG